MDQTLATPLSILSFNARLKDKMAYYNIHYPYHIAIHNGHATRAQIQEWVAICLYYQVSIPHKDATIIANCSDLAVRWQ
ncbi:hypothetical protein [Sodalis-like endosymbiont of Proechinophthirus fluctus]|uniref:hypothetical protein n=1 Tax=Sodalis-like endosymbiont of Proechinophthirus fluctus TaxID=1462730 RepID=UPI0008356C00|nr:hypothetical protein [Sodalis-like endosymbiont of Proechinophthirus fluctus]